MRLVIALSFVLVGCLAGRPAIDFDAAVLKVNTSHDPATGVFENGRVIIHNQNLRTLIGAAYHIPNPRVEGPAWLDDTRFDVVAKTDASTTEDGWRMMLQNLLVQQLRLDVRRTQKIEPAYALVAEKGGLKIHESPSGQTAHTNCTVLKVGMVDCLAVTLTAFAGFLPQLGGSVDYPAKDGTGLQGPYEIKLTWSSTPDGPSLFEALREQLGLKLVVRKLAVDYLVVDRAERVPLDQ